MSQSDVQIIAEAAPSEDDRRRVRALEAEVRQLRRKLVVSERALSQSEKLQALGQLISGVAHELANPLTAVIARAVIIRSATTLDEAKRQAETIEEQAQRATKIVRNLSAFARRRRADHATISVNDVVRSVVDLHGYQLAACNIELAVELPDDGPLVEADPHELEQVLLNLVTNAQYAMMRARGRGRLLIRATATEREVLLRVEDDGPGIPADVLPHIFEPFFTTKGEDGTGLGLAIVRDLLARHGGSISVETAEERGSTMTVVLPRVRDHIPARSTKAPPRRRGRLLVVDDEPEVGELLASLLHRRGYEAEFVTSAALALERVRTTAFHAILTDIRMPAMRGDELWRVLSRERPDLARRTVLITGDHAAPETAELVESVGIPCLTKPFRPDELDEILAGLDRPDPGRAAVGERVPGAACRTRGDVASQSP